MSRRQVTLASGAFLCFSIVMFFATDTNRPILESSPIPVSYADPPPPPRLAAGIDRAQQIYIAVLDREYKPAPIQCTLKKAWIDQALKKAFIDGVEFYSSASFLNRDCDVRTISFSPVDDRFPVTRDPSCVIMRTVIRSFLDRSDAGWLLIVTDGTFVDTDKLDSLLNRRIALPELECHVAGQCREVRDYFQVFTEESGTLMSRATAQRLNGTGKTWDVACAIEITGNEALAHAMDVHGLLAIRNHNKRFLGQPFPSASDYTALKTRNFQRLRPCPKKYQANRVCDPTVQPVRDLIIWGGAGQAISKVDFVRTASEMLHDLPSSVMFRYDTYNAELCMGNE